MRIVCVKHGHGPDDDRVVTWCALNGVTADIRRPFAGQSVGEFDEDVGGVVFYGGMQNAYDTELHPSLNIEYDFMDKALKANVPVLGICQGAQMIAHHMGAFAGAAENGMTEFGYYEIRPTDEGRDIFPQPLHVSQWHFHRFDIPAGAKHLARSAHCDQQAFSVGDTVLAVQFHPENTIETMRRWQARASAEDWAKPGVQPLAAQREAMLLHDEAQAKWFYGALDRLFGSARSTAKAAE